MIYALYTLALALSLILLSPYFYVQSLRKKKSLGHLSARLGLTQQTHPTDQPILWIHAVSVGETLAVQPLVRSLHNQFPTYRLVFSTTTTTGQDIARRRLPELVEVILFPLDFAFSVRRVLDDIAPSLVLIVETEIWPNFLRVCRGRGIPVLMVNGRISDGSFTGYRRMRPFMTRVLQGFQLMLMQSPRDAERILALGADKDRVFTTGNLKYDIEMPDLESKVGELDRLFQLSNGRLIVAGSTGQGEERIILDAFMKLIRQPGLADLRLLLAPRHPERFDEVAEMIRETGLNFVRRSQTPAKSCVDSPPTILLDSMGELAAAYAVADLVFVGGSLVPLGGHNILEPALFGKPIIVGPFTSNFRAIVDEFIEEQAIVQLKADTSPAMEDQIYEALQTLFNRPEERNSLGERARNVLDRNRGATNRTLQFLRPYLATAENAPVAAQEFPSRLSS